MSQVYEWCSGLKIAVKTSLDVRGDGRDLLTASVLRSEAGMFLRKGWIDDRVHSLKDEPLQKHFSSAER